MCPSIRLSETTLYYSGKEVLAERKLNKIKRKGMKEKRMSRKKKKDERN